MGNHAEEDYFGLLFLKKNCDKTLKNIHAILSFSQCYKEANYSTIRNSEEEILFDKLYENK